MFMRLVPLILLLTSLLISPTAYAQNGMDFTDFSKKLELYFDKEFVEDVRSQLPQGTDYKIWGWDVGDFSGDGYNDVAFSIRLQGDKRKQVTAYLFVDIDGYLQNVGSYQNRFVEIPLEVGIAIKNNTCYITQKRKQYDWIIRGYRFTNGSLLKVDEYTTYRVERYTRESYRNFVSLRSEERYLQTSNNDVVFSNDFLTIPCYNRGEVVYKDSPNIVDVRSIDYVSKGSFWWTGEEDCSFTLRSVYDDNFLYMTITVKDDQIVTARCDTCPSDNIDIWFDSTPTDTTGDRTMIQKGKRLQIKTAPDSNIYRIALSLGDFLEKRPSVAIKAMDASLDDVQLKIAVQQISKKVILRPNGYVAKLRIPFSLLGFDKAPLDEKNINEIGCSVVVHDIDNEYRPEEETTLATSQIKQMNPSTLGILKLIQTESRYGESVNIFSDSLVKFLNDLGY